jgi:hypothetical protein
MDIGANGGHPSLDEFTKKTGIKVNYTENIQDNPSYWNEHVRPQLSAGKSQGHDIIVLTNNDYPLGFLLNFGWAIPLDHRAMKNFDKYASDKVTHLAVLDIVPTYYLYTHVTIEFVQAYFHWFNNVRPAPGTLCEGCTASIKNWLVIFRALKRN